MERPDACDNQPLRCRALGDSRTVTCPLRELSKKAANQERPGVETVCGTTATRRPARSIRFSTSRNEASWNHRFEPKKHKLPHTAERHPPPQTEESDACTTGRVRQLPRHVADRCSPSLFQADWASPDQRLTRPDARHVGGAKHGRPAPLSTDQLPNSRFCAEVISSSVSRPALCYPARFRTSPTNSPRT